MFYVLALIAILHGATWCRATARSSSCSCWPAITTVSAVWFMFVWTLILLSYLQYRKHRAARHQAYQLVRNKRHPRTAVRNG